MFFNFMNIFMASFAEGLLAPSTWRQHLINSVNSLSLEKGDDASSSFICKTIFI